MRTLTILAGFVLVVGACIFCYWAGQNDRLTQAEAELLRVQAAEIQEQIRLKRLAALTQPRREETTRDREWATQRLLALPVDTVRQPRSHRLAGTGPPNEPQTVSQTSAQRRINEF